MVEQPVRVGGGISEGHVSIACYTVESFETAFGRKPVNDDLDRVNCSNVGAVGHLGCGVCPEHAKPHFECGCRAVHKRPYAPPKLTPIGPDDPRAVALRESLSTGEPDRATSEGVRAP
jgi:hypothetical protein